MVFPRSNQLGATWGTLQDHIVATLQSTAWEESENTREYLDTVDILNQEERKAQAIERRIQKRLERQRELERKLERERKAREQVQATLEENTTRGESIGSEL